MSEDDHFEGRLGEGFAAKLVAAAGVEPESVRAIVSDVAAVTAAVRRVIEKWCSSAGV